MARFTELNDEELQAKAEELGVEDAGTLTRNQLEAAILEKDPTATDEPVNTSMADKGEFSTPVVDQGEVPSAADEGERELSGSGSEIPPAEGEVADQSSAGGTGGTTVDTTGNTGSL